MSQEDLGDYTEDPKNFVSLTSENKDSMENFYRTSFSAQLLCAQC